MPGYKPNDTIAGYRVQRVERVDEIDAVVTLLVHQATGARHLHIANADKENTFSVAFKTVPADSTGVAHVLEHTVLCGSRHYPVRDPFFSMLKRSLSTFMNAFTASDWTMYPFSTQNHTDFTNLMNVYLDAAFYPRIERLSFRQEGHRLEFEPDGEGGERLVYKGVVFNEMKGAMSSPDQVMGRSLLNALYPDTTYSHNSGGDPAAIPRLTHEGLVAFHRRHYHPSNAFFYTYGNLPIEDHLARIEEKVLAHFDAIDPGTEVPAQPRWQTPRQVAYAYPLAPGEDPTRRHQACVAWLTADIQDSFEVLVLSVLEQVLLGNDASPLRRALMDAGLGSALSDGTGFDADNRDTLFSAGLKDVAAEDAAPIEAIVFDTLRGLAQEGIPAELVESAVHQIEFHRKEVTNHPYPYGLKLLLHFAGSWIHGGDPLQVLRFDADIRRLRDEIAQGGFLEQRLRDHFIDNPHRVRFLLEPDLELAGCDQARENAELAEKQAALSAAEKEAIRADAEALRRLQDAEEDASCLPTLALSEIPLTVPRCAPSSDYAGVPVRCYTQPTAGIVYFSAAAGIGRVPADRLWLLPFFCYAAGRIGTRQRDYADMAQRIDTYTGGVGLSVQARTRFDADRGCLPFVAVSGKSLVRNRETLFNILGELLGEPDFSDTAHLQRLLLEYKAMNEAAVVHAGHRLAMLLAARRLTPAAALNEQWDGVHQLLAVKERCRDLDEAALATLAGELADLARAIYAAGNLKMALVSEPEIMPSVAAALGAFQERLDAGPAAFDAPAPDLGGDPVREGWATSTSVNFVASCFPTVRLGHADAPVLSVIAKMLRSLYLHREIREKGGAYGGFAAYNVEDGLFSFGSYRDPHIDRTLAVYDRAATFLLDGRFTDEDVREAVLQVCSEIDRPDPPGTLARKAFFRELVGLDDDSRLAFKRGLLDLDRNRVRQAAETYFGTPPESRGIAVIGGEPQLSAANAKLHDNPLVIKKI